MIKNFKTFRNTYRYCMGVGNDKFLKPMYNELMNCTTEKEFQQWCETYILDINHYPLFRTKNIKS